MNFIKYLAIIFCFLGVYMLARYRLINNKPLLSFEDVEEDPEWAGQRN